MIAHRCTLLIWVLMVTNYSTSFEITKRHGSRVKLSKQLAAFQRLRRQVSPEYTLHGNPLSAEDVSDWFRTSETHDASSNRGHDAASRVNQWLLGDPGSLLEPNRRQQDLFALVPVWNELQDKYDESNKEDFLTGSTQVSAGHQDNMIKEPPRLDGINKTKQKKTRITEESVSKDLALDMLTKEEFESLMKAIDKLRRQSAKFSEDPAEVRENTAKETNDFNKAASRMFVVKAPSMNVLDSMSHALNTAGANDDDVLIESITELNHEKPNDNHFALHFISNRTSVPNNIDILFNEMAPDALDNISNEGERNKGREVTPADRITVKKAKNIGPGLSIIKRQKQLQTALTLSAIREMLNDGIDVQKISDIANLLTDHEQDDTLSVEEKFLKKFLELQEEAGRLKMIVELENLENDILTDALNEASLGQEEGSVSRLEFDSLKQAIQIEEALRDLKKSRQGKHTSDGVIEISKLQEQKRGSGSASYNHVTSNDDTQLSNRGGRITKDDLQRLLGQVYMLKDEDKRDMKTNLISPSHRTIKAPGVCPPVDEQIVCTWTDLASIPADVKAKSLCAWKDTCCGCGSTKGTSFHLGWEKCHPLSQTIASALCGHDDCSLESLTSPRPKTTSHDLNHIMSLGFASNPGGHLWTCHKSQQVGLWVCGYCQSVGR